MRDIQGMITTVIIPTIFLQQVGRLKVKALGKPGKPGRQGPPCGLGTPATGPAALPSLRLAGYK
uniref:Uncharacterized protein n=1 Tax=mine drainage metagenome TaxID=410659 RepID=E6PSN6_9ZZZZ